MHETAIGMSCLCWSWLSISTCNPCTHGGNTVQHELQNLHTVSFTPCFDIHNGRPNSQWSLERVQNAGLFASVSLEPDSAGRKGAP